MHVCDGAEDAVEQRSKEMAVLDDMFGDCEISRVHWGRCSEESEAEGIGFVGREWW
jgi:hypothetical protein